MKELKLVYKFKRPTYSSSSYTTFSVYDELDLLKFGDKAEPVGELRLNHLKALAGDFKGRNGPLVAIDRSRKDKSGNYPTVPFPQREHFIPEKITIKAHQNVINMIPKRCNKIAKKNAFKSYAGKGSPAHKGLMAYHAKRKAEKEKATENE